MAFSKGKRLFRLTDINDETEFFSNVFSMICMLIFYTTVCVASIASYLVFRDHTKIVYRGLMALKLVVCLSRHCGGTMTHFSLSLTKNFIPKTYSLILYTQQFRRFLTVCKYIEQISALCSERSVENLSNRSSKITREKVGCIHLLFRWPGII